MSHAAGHSRLVAPLTNPNAEEHRRQIALRANSCLPRDGTEAMGAPLQLYEVAVADLPDASMWEGGLIYVPDEVGGAVVAFSDGANWRRVTDRAVVS